ncbi:hypothetical protein ABB37_03840 [Leptomonas pyrrhocoris]|uniref:Uncharacterized protein n=1 Tax=Leptomonas pyrrhocoris TaxID=157538 RepID=A0A0M9G3H2_LEPPY|nr:hypothetical protein ABB37_03840 [Leptomonas pyrrhocoris]KPA81483.1 hypothetical protein ABB37_03840 [Leptomonas pyrrhocoris]|eukprot:XP_015659922.1 hypothetical protein ABB37_03840 [Leptomonas pyrrhocoris]
MSGSDNKSSRPTDNSGVEVPALNIHPKFMTNRNGASSRSSTRQGTPRSEGAIVAAVPTNAELAEAGVPLQDGVVRQLSARKQERGSLAAPRPVAGNGSRRRAPAAIAAGSGIGEPLQLSEPRQRRGNSGTPRSPQQQPSRHAPYAGGSRASLGSSREPIRPGRNAGQSPLRSPSKHHDPYGHVTSVVRDYRNNNISALEAQYRNVRSHSASHVPPARDPVEYRSTSQQQEDEDRAPTPRSTRQDSPQPRDSAADYLRGGVPRVALEAPHIKYAEALERMNNPRYSPRVARAYTPSTSTASAPFLPQAAQSIPDRLKYVEPSEEEKKRRKAETLRLLQEWRERQKARSAGAPPARVPPPPREQQQQSSAKAAPRMRSTSRNRGSARSQPRPVEPAVLEEKPEWDSTFEPGFGTPPRTPRTSSRAARSARSGRKSGAASRASSRKGRKSRGATPPASARGDGTTNPNAFRRRLLFDVTAPALFVA